jgi:hypothetical protein
MHTLQPELEQDRYEPALNGIATAQSVFQERDV